MTATLEVLDAKLDSIMGDLSDMKPRLRAVELTSAANSATLTALKPHNSPCVHTHPEIADLKARGDRNDVLSTLIATIPGVAALIALFNKP